MTATATGAIDAGRHMDRIYRRQRPKEKNELTVEIKAGGENRLQIEVFGR